MRRISTLIIIVAGLFAVAGCSGSLCDGYGDPVLKSSANTGCSGSAFEDVSLTKSTPGPTLTVEDSAGDMVLILNNIQMNCGIANETPKTTVTIEGNVLTVRYELSALAKCICKVEALDYRISGLAYGSYLLNYESNGGLFFGTPIEFKKGGSKTIKLE